MATKKEHKRTLVRKVRRAENMKELFENMPLWESMRESRVHEYHSGYGRKTFGKKNSIDN